MREACRRVSRAWTLVVLLLAVMAADGAAQTYTFAHRWRIEAGGVPVAAPRTIDLRQTGTLTPRLRFGVFVGSPAAWTKVNFTSTGPGPLWIGGIASSTNGQPGCGSYTNASGCLNLGTPNVGVYMVTANVQGFGQATVPVIVGGGSPVALAGPQAFAFGGTSTGTGFQYGLSLGNAQPGFQSASLTPGLGPGGIAVEMAALINGVPGYTAVVAGPAVIIDTIPPGGAFRFWIDDFQVTGGGGSFNPDVDDVSVKALPVDRQPGRNFPLAVSAFGTSRSENVAVGDIDNDGDLDVGVANGGLGAAQADRVYINDGGIQGGVQGGFTDQTNARLPGFPIEKSRDIEFVDTDGDFDLDVFMAATGNTVTGGGVSRFGRNQGGPEGGLIGFFLEDTDGFWGDLLSVPLDRQVLGGNQGPWRGYACDCDFGDLDLDGDVDLFHSNYGPNLLGNEPSRVFLNDGTGRFDERWPWADAAADVHLHTIDVDLADLDGDFDLDVIASSRGSQARLYRNDLDAGSMDWAADPFVDVTQTALLDQGAAVSGLNNYEVEPGDLDGDGDLDLWMTNYAGFADRILRNDGGLVFSMQPSWIKGDPNLDELEADYLDYDGDGDLDVSMANFSGANWLYVNGLADDLDVDSVGLLHRSGTASAGSLAPWPETPTNASGNVSKDTEAADMDGDGDPDLVVAFDNNRQNRYWENTLGIPDTHAPSVELITVQGDKSDGSDTPIRVQLRDNAGFATVARYDMHLVYTLDGGFVNRSPMTSQGGWSFQATIPGGLDGSITYWIEGHDEGQNMVASVPVTYEQTSSGVTLIRSVGEGTPGVFRRPWLAVEGELLGNDPVTIVLRDTVPTASVGWFFSLSSTPLAFKGGLLHTVPVLDVQFVSTDAGGQFPAVGVWPPGLPPGLDLWTQFGIPDASALKGATLSNAVRLTTP